MKKTPLFVASAIALTLVFYMAAYYLLPGDPPSAGLVGLFAALALAVVWAVNALWSKKAAVKPKPRTPNVPPAALWIGVGVIGLLAPTQAVLAQTASGLSAPTISCSADPSSVLPGGSATIAAVAVSPANRPLQYRYSATAGLVTGTASTATLSTAGAPPGAIAVSCTVADDQGQTASATTIVTVLAIAAAPPRAPVVVGGGAPPALDRVTGTAVLLAGKKEPDGYGLYSYALLFHPPSAAELPRYQAFLKALVDLPAAEGLARYVPKSRINVTSIPLTAADPGWERDEVDGKVAFILKHYDYARAAAIRASLSTMIGSGPVLLSVLHPVNPAEHPTPVLVQDMTRAQASLMSAYVQSFVSQAARERFWQESELSQFALGLRNALETAATGLNLSQTAVDGWIKFFK